MIARANKAALTPPRLAPPARRVAGEYDDVVRRLNRASVRKYYQAYVDVPWDEHTIDAADPRWIPRSATLTRSEWFRGLPSARQARLCLHMSTTFMKLGVQFENVLCRGLLEFAATLPDHSPGFRYAHHEVIEEANHSLMFQEFVNRSGLSVAGLSPRLQLRAGRMARLGRTFPELFFIFVLGGEEAIDYQQRVLLLNPRQDIHPLLRRVSEIHVTEEVRHISFARALLRDRVPRLSRLDMFRLRIGVPTILGFMARIMTEPSPQIVSEYAIPRAALAEAYHRNAEHKEHVRNSLADVVELCRELGVLTPRSVWLWRRAGLIV
jgi:hypothetical protein